MTTHAPAQRLARGDLPVNVALMHVLMQAESVELAREAIEAARLHAAEDLGDAGARRLDRALGLLGSCPDAFGLVKSVLARVDHRPGGVKPEVALANLARDFDAVAALSPAAGSALYALGDRDLLAAATDEAVALMRGLGVLGVHKRVLEVGCGSGRFLSALAYELDFIIGLEIAPGMATAAADSVRGVGTAAVVLGRGDGLDMIADGCVDLVLFADSFPYLVQVGEDLARRCIGDCARVLRADGRVLIFNLTYREDLARDRRDLARWADEAGLHLERVGERELSLWDATSFLLAPSTNRPERRAGG